MFEPPPFCLRRRLRAFVLGAIPSAALRGTCGRAVALATPVASIQRERARSQRHEKGGPLQDRLSSSTSVPTYMLRAMSIFMISFDPP